MDESQNNNIHPRESGNPIRASRPRIKSGVGLFFALFLFSVFYFLFSAQAAHAATLYLSPSTGSYGVGSTITVSVRTNTQGQAANTAEANISYSSTTLELTKVAQGSTFYLPAPGSPAKSGGSAYFGGGVPNPGYSGTAGNVGTLTFRAVAAGEATITITSGKVLLNDGFGTDALSGTQSAHFTITQASVTPPPATPAGGPGGPVVSSSTHPDPSKWYKDTTIQLSWTRPDAAYGFSFELDQKSDTDPDNVLDTTVTTAKTYTDLVDGVYYFHIKSRAQPVGSTFGPVTHFKISIDTKPPQSFQISAIGKSIAFKTTDALSGIDHYAIFVDGQKYLETSDDSLTLSNLSGQHTVKVTAYDKAGNSTDAESQINFGATANFLTRTLSVPMYVILFFNLLILLLLALIAWLIARRNRKSQTAGGIEIDRVQEEIDASLEDLKVQISKKLNTLNETSSEELFAKETAVAKEIRGGIVKTRKKIDGRLGKIRRRKIEPPKVTEE